MKQQSLAVTAEFERFSRPTRRAEFLSRMERVVPWAELVALVEPHYPKGDHGRPPVGVERMLRIYFLQQWFDLSDPAVEDALYDSATMRRFVGVDLGQEPAPDETTVCKFRHLLERHGLGKKMLATVNGHLERHGLKIGTGTIVDATLLHAPSSTKNKSGQRDPEMHQVKKGNQWYFGMKCHIGVDADSGLVHTVVGTAANVNDVTQAHALVHGEEADVFADAGYQGVDKREDTQGIRAHWHVALRPGLRRLLDATHPKDAIAEQMEQVKASIRAKVEHPFRVIKRQFGHVKVRYRGLAKNTAQLHTLFALSNLWMARRQLMAAQG